MTGPPSPALNLLPDATICWARTGPEEGDRPRVVRAVFREARGLSEPGGGSLIQPAAWGRGQKKEKRSNLRPKA